MIGGGETDDDKCERYATNAILPTHDRTGHSCQILLRNKERINFYNRAGDPLPPYPTNEPCPTPLTKLPKKNPLA